MPTHSNLSMSLLIKYSKIFGDEPRSVEDILTPYGKTLTLKMIGVLNSMLQRGITELQQQIVSWFGHKEPLGQELMERIFFGYRAEINEGFKLVLINHYANLRMSVIAKSLPEIDENSVINTNQAHLDLFKAYLKLNEAFLLKQNQIGTTIPEQYSGILRATWLSTASLISYYDFSYIDQIIAVCQLIKAMYCLQFIEQYNSELYELYLQSKDVSGFKDYAVKIFPLTQLCFSDAVTINGLNEENKKFLELYNHQTDIEESEENVANFDFLAIRNKPLFAVGENEYVILNRAMIINKVYSSIYWDCKAILSNNLQLGISQDRFRTDFTTDFSEGYLVYKLFKKAYENKSCKQFSGEEMKAQMGNSEPDYYIRNGNKVFIIEVKDSFISGKVKQSFNVPDIQEEISKKYYKTQNSEKAVKQLITRIRFSLTMAYPFDQGYKPKSLKFFPILIVYDVNLTVPGIESLMAGWFNDERENLIAEMKEQGIEGFHINDLVILHIDGLVLLTEYIRAGKVKLEDLIDSHLARKRTLLKINETKTFEEVKAGVLNSYFSFNHYVLDHRQAIPPQSRIMPTEFNIFSDE
ncbi:hypothetical protein BDE36_0380 [Arcticibacter tournemirensis]|uniref:Uncharacterized protein n=1 Tax=Arcticibacter tournemirensis TaxID=699437 RepID=A0A5M9HJH4_9SPHI|nr:hypothetical protein [Arcticibacter tournemirensis]KAA8485591.1 hypothetical protein F1649_03670 [Arcticibacter tournemirensis]TQM48691.1 hypothetical protein BDE36_0380 [Arcticibacter tournemirensis]